MTSKPLSIENILHEYEKIRLNNKRLLQERKEKIYSEIPRISDIDSESTFSYLDVARMRVLGQDNTKEKTSLASYKNRELAKEKALLLEQHGYPSDYLDPIYNCKKCQDTGYIAQEKCSCFITRIIDSLYIQSNLSNILEKENFKTFSFEYYSKEKPIDKQYSPFENVSSIVEHSKKFVKRFSTQELDRGNLLIYGETGLGKTFLTNCIAKDLLDSGHSVLYLSAGELFESVLAGYLMNQKIELEDLFRYIYNSELLIIDDLGTELTNNFVLSQLFEIINQRGISGRSTLISTNLSMKQLRDRYSERIMSRIIANYTVFNMYGDNIRYQKRKKEISNS